MNFYKNLSTRVFGSMSQLLKRNMIEKAGAHSRSLPNTPPPRRVSNTIFSPAAGNLAGGSSPIFAKKQFETNINFFLIFLN